MPNNVVRNGITGRPGASGVSSGEEVCAMRTFPIVVERDPQTGLLVGYVPGWPGAHTQAADTRELEENMREVIEMLLEDGEPSLESEFIDVRSIQVA
jgi:predicted RNase H-like HicB family nuclease